VGNPKRIERLNYGISAGVILIALFTQSRPVTLGLAVGAGLTCLNFYVLRRLIVKWTAEAAKGRGGRRLALLAAGAAVAAAAVAAAVLLLPLDVVAFAIGYSIFIVSIIIETTYTALRPSAADSASENDHG